MTQNQSNRCGRNATFSKEKVYDGNACDQYAQSIDVENQANKIESHVSSTYPAITNNAGEVNSNVITSERLWKYSIHEWLSFFLFIVLVGGILSFIVPCLLQFCYQFYESNALFLATLLLGGVFFVIALLTLYSFLKRKSNAVFWAKTYVVGCFVSHLNVLIVLLGGDRELGAYTNLFTEILALCWQAGWFIYLCFAEQVSDIIPKEYRKTSFLDYGILLVLILIVVLVGFIAGA